MTKSEEFAIVIILIIILCIASIVHCEEQWKPYTWAVDSNEVVIVQAINELGLHYNYQCKAVFESNRAYRLVSTKINKIDLLKGNLTYFTANKYHFGDTLILR